MFSSGSQVLYLAKSKRKSNREGGGKKEREKIISLLMMFQNTAVEDSLGGGRGVPRSTPQSIISSPTAMFATNLH